MMLSGNALLMREVNTNLVRQALKSLRHATKQQVAAATGLSTVTAATIIQQLVERGEVVEIDLAPSGGGRPAHQFRFNADFAHVLVLFTHEQDGQDLLRVRVANLYGEVVHAQDAALRDIRPESFEPWAAGCLQAYPTIRAIGFGLPGLEVGGQIIVNDYPALVGARLADAYTQRFQRPVIFENDVNAAVIGYATRHGLRPDGALIYAYFPKKYPPGAGIALDGRLYKGFSNFAGEINAIPLGVDWRDPALYQSPAAYCSAIARLVTSMSSLLNPHNVVLYGSFLTTADVEHIHRQCAAQLPASALPNLLLSQDFSADFQAGMVAQTLACLEPQLALTHTSV